MPPGTAMITGAARGLGAELCRSYLRRGWRVLAVSRRPGVAGAETGELHEIEADVGKPEARETIGRAAASLTPSIDVLVNNAGIGGQANRLAEVSSAEMSQLFDVHCLGALRCTRAVLPLLEAGQQPKVINVTSRVASFARGSAGEFADEGISYAYRVTKAAQNMLTLAMSEELGTRGVVVCAVHPGEFASHLNPEGEEDSGTAAERLVDWMASVGWAENGGWYDPRKGRIPW